MKNFYWYSIIAFLVTIPAFIEERFFVENYSPTIINYSLIFHFAFLGNFIIKVLPMENKKPLLYFLYFFFLALIIYILVINDQRQMINKAFSITNLGLALFSMIYYYQIFKYPTMSPILKEPSFWIVTGVFICMGICAPASAIIDFLKPKLSFYSFRFFRAIIVNSYLIMHLMFIKAYLCSIKKQIA